MTARIIVTGARSWTDYDRLVFELAHVIAFTSSDVKDAVIVHGAATSGADLLAAKACEAHGWAAEPHPADWENCATSCKPKHRRSRPDGTSYCPSAGHRRNQEMADAGAAAAVAFLMPCTQKRCARRGVHMTHGTADCIERLGTALIPVWMVMEGVSASWVGLDGARAGAAT